MDRWVVGLLVGFLAVFVANGVMIYLSVTHAPQIEASYAAERGMPGHR